MTLKEFLEYFEFDYRIRGKEIQLIDTTGTNLGNIESETFPIDDLTTIVDRLDIYYKDYVFDDLAEKYGIDPDDWQSIYEEAKEQNSNIDILPIIMGDEELVLRPIIVHNIKWDADEDTDLLPKYIVIPEGVTNDEMEDYISDLTGFCFENFEIGLDFIDCIHLIRECINAKLLQYDETINNGSILVYRTAGTENPEGWYWENVLEAAKELYDDFDGQIALVNALNKL